MLHADTISQVKDNVFGFQAGYHSEDKDEYFYGMMPFDYK
jgi:hypothetical protein